jgi:hypothetical protein
MGPPEADRKGLFLVQRLKLQSFAKQHLSKASTRFDPIAQGVFARA